jgi:hypothetical protein
VGHAVTDARRRLITLEPFYSCSNFFARPLFQQLIAETLDPLLFPIVIEGVVGFKTNDASAMPLRYALPLLAK